MVPFTSSIIINIPSVWLILLFMLFQLNVHGSAAKGYWDAGLKLHNEYRAYHKTVPLVLDPGLAVTADKCAKHYADVGKIDHSCPDKADFGENLYWTSDTGMDEISGVKAATKRWYDEIQDYDFEKQKAKPGKKFKDIGHFTQLVWKDSKRLGMGFAKIDKGIYVVALYDPPGNYVGMHKENVLPPSSAASGSRVKLKSKGIDLLFLAVIMIIGFFN